MTDTEKLDWVHFAIQEAMAGNTEELEAALAFLEDVRETHLAEST